MQTWRKLLNLAIITVAVLVRALFQTTLAFFPPLFKLYHEKRKDTTAMAITGYPVDAYAHSYGKWSTYLFALKHLYVSIMRNEAEMNGKAPNPKVYTSDGKTRVNLLDAASPGRPLVLNFGSCS